jgi:hypothetical protein
MSTLRTFVESVHTGQTNITRVLSKLMQYPARWQDNTGDITVDPLSSFLNAQFSAPGRMTPEEVSHIEHQWPMAQKETLRDEVIRAIQADRRMVFKWGLTSDDEPRTDVAWPPDNTPLDVPVLVTFLSPRRGVTYSPQFQGTDEGVIIET